LGFGEGSINLMRRQGRFTASDADEEAPMSQTAANAEWKPGSAGTGPGIDRHPAGLYILFATEMWERYGFYTILAVMTLYLQDKSEGFGWTKDQATSLWANNLMFVYLTPFIGGWIADRFLGYRRSILIGGTVFVAGYLLLGMGSIASFYIALALIYVGNGFFKPNISTMVGNLYPPGSPLRDSAYNIFYMGINVGAFAAPLVAEVLRQKYGFRAAFFAAGIGMALGTIIFAICYRFLSLAERKKTVDDPRPMELAEDLFPAPEELAIDKVPAWKRVVALIVIYAIVIVFWMAFHQNGSTMTYWANDNTDWKASKVTPILIQILTLNLIDGSDVSGVISNAINPFWIIVLSIPLVRFWRWLNRKGLEPSTPTKIALGMVMTSLAFLILALGGVLGGDTGRVSPWWIIGAYFVISLGELMLSPMGLSLVSKVAPPHMRGLMMGGWFVATALGNKLTQIGVLWTKWPHSQFWLLLASMSLGMAFVLLALLRPLKRAMPGV
jgi:proton-dependent oligopeptide transporter, POT family